VAGEAVDGEAVSIGFRKAWRPTPGFVCKVFEGETLGLDLWLGRVCGIARRGRFGDGICQIFPGEICGGTEEDISQGLKPGSSDRSERPKAEALGYLEAKATTKTASSDATTAVDSSVATAKAGCSTTAGYSTTKIGFCGGLVVAGLLMGVGCAPPRSSRVVVGSKNFTEQVVLGELVAQEIEAVFAEEGKAGERVDRRFYLAGSYLCQQALVSGRIDGYVEYTGTALVAILKQPLPPVGQRDAATVLRRVRELYGSRYGVRVGPPLGFENTFAMVVRGEDARRFGLKTISDAVGVIDPASSEGKIGSAASDGEKSASIITSKAKTNPTSDVKLSDMGHPVPRDWRLGVGYEFQSRPDGLRGLEAAYGLRFSEPPRTMDLGLLYRALAGGQVDMVAGNSTDGPIRALGFVVLADDRHYFPPYEAVPLFREDSLRAHPEIQVALDRLAGKVDASQMQTMNDAVDGQHRDVGQVVREFRRGRGL
jgi:osmoprotectant transport system substrate-binding protein